MLIECLNTNDKDSSLSKYKQPIENNHFNSEIDNKISDKSPVISVIMPLYHTNYKHLKSSIASILSQTFRDFELLILNDSPENVKLDKVVESFNDSRIKYIKKDHNLGISEAHNTLLKLAKGRYIAIMDHDDISLPSRLEKQYNYMEQHEDVGLLGAAFKKFGKWNKYKDVYHPSDHKDIEASLLFKSPIHHPTSMIRKSVIDKYNISYDKQFVSLNDRKLYWDISKKAKLHNLSEVLYKYRIHSAMTSRVRRNDIRQEQLRYRSSLLMSYGVNLSDDELNILNQYVLNGRCCIKSCKILEQVKDILEKLVAENRDKHFVDEQAFERVCGTYLVKRCKNAALKGFISSEKIISQTALPTKVPLWLSVFNFVVRSK